MDYVPVSPSSSTMCSFSVAGLQLCGRITFHTVRGWPGWGSPENMP
jgi:hypothetical protein